MVFLLLKCINEYKINTSYFGFGPLFLMGSPFFLNFVVSVEEVAPDKFLSFGLGLGFNFSARRLLLNLNKIQNYNTMSYNRRFDRESKFRTVEDDQVFALHRG